MDNEFEYVIVGSGAGGGPLAANLARAGRRVLLLEAGGAPEPESLNSVVPAFHPAASEEPGMSWRFFVRHYADPARQRRDSKYCPPPEDGIFYPRAGTLGGCTTHNAMVLDYPSNSDWDAIAELTGDESWSAGNMRRHFQRLERCRYRQIQRLLQWLFRHNPSRHGFDGWMATDRADPHLLDDDRKLKKLVIDSALAVLFGGGFKRLLNRIVTGLLAELDPNDWKLVRTNAEGLRLTPLTVSAGRRWSVRQLLLETSRQLPDKLTIRLGALAARVLFDGERRAVGVEYLEGEHLYRADPLHRPDQEGVPRQVRATREVILAGGAFNSPQLLQLSGIGPAELLRQHGIPVLVDLPGVGASLQDRYEVGVVLRMKKDFQMLEGATLRPPAPGQPPDPQFRQWLKGRGVYATNGVVLSIIKRSSPSRPIPDLYMFGLVSNFRGYYPGYSEDALNAHRYFTWAILKGHTHNTAGRVAIRSRDPRDMPEIDFHYFDEGNDAGGEDLEAVVSAVEMVRAITAGYGDLVEAEEVPGPQVKSRDQIRQFVKDEAWGHHASCTCQIGPADDRQAVLDSNFRVHGIKGLRVVDASAFPRIPGLFVVSAVYMIAEKASQVILADAAAADRGAAAERGGRGG